MNNYQKRKLLDVSLFNRWIRQMDEKDKCLHPAKRKGKWALTLSAFFLFFASSFLWIPGVQITKKQLAGPISHANEKGTVKEALPFEMPTDSFEIQLKQNIHENLPEKE